MSRLSYDCLSVTLRYTSNLKKKTELRLCGFFLLCILLFNDINNKHVSSQLLQLHASGMQKIRLQLPAKAIVRHRTASTFTTQIQKHFWCAHQPFSSTLKLTPLQNSHSGSHSRTRPSAAHLDHPSSPIGLLTTNYASAVLTTDYTQKPPVFRGLMKMDREGRI